MKVQSLVRQLLLENKLSMDDCRVAFRHVDKNKDGCAPAASALSPEPSHRGPPAPAACHQRPLNKKRARSTTYRCLMGACRMFPRAAWALEESAPSLAVYAHVMPPRASS